MGNFFTHSIGMWVVIEKKEGVGGKNTKKKIIFRFRRRNQPIGIAEEKPFFFMAEIARNSRQ